VIFSTVFLFCLFPPAAILQALILEMWHQCRTRLHIRGQSEQIRNAAVVEQEIDADRVSTQKCGHKPQTSVVWRVVLRN
jgi:hypothetical protein